MCKKTTKFMLLFLLVAGASLAGDAPPPVPAGDADKTEAAGQGAPQQKADKKAKMVTVNFRNTEIVSVIDYYSKMLGKPFIIDSKLKGKVTVISPVPIPQAQALSMLDTILAMHGYGLVETEGYIKLVQRSKITRDSLHDLTRTTPADRIVSEVISMKYIAARQLLEQVRPLLSQDGNAIVSESLNSMVLTDTAGNIAKIKRIIQALDRESKALRTRVYHLKFASAEKLSSSLPGLLTGGEKEGGLKPSVAVDKDTNSVIITGTKLMHSRMEQLLPQLDARRGQVLIEVKIVEVSHTASSRMGLEWKNARDFVSSNNNKWGYKIAQSAFKLDDKNNLTGVPGLRFSLTHGDRWTALLNNYATSEDVNLLSSPHLVAMDGQTAKMHIGEEIPILKESRVDQNNNPVNSFDYQKVGIDLTIKPKIIGDGEVMLTLKQEVSTLLQFNEERLTHRIGERMAETSVILKNRHTLVIGGLLKDSKRKSNTGVPVLRNIPVLGKLFSQQSQTNSPEKTELLIFITPIIMGTPTEADRVTEEIQEKHPKTYLPSGEDFRL